ncbi:hypothetical protein SAMN06295885_3509 [Rathayibacter oskolensis]|uniref:Uncharacterized protein n=1 Tax=Rathayibacter oskolensis TaxID=1891671 RepID=A0A1X7PFU1_9MICO|nr:hypothetical protein [Rathayibacter oskolensis]SMH50328.1 hypothetical protein SAMN06295885_3509 [Rathayibacter oskolensis]
MDSWRRDLPEEEWLPVYTGSVESVPREALEAAVRILRLLPQIERLTITTPEGPVGVERRSSATAWRAADRVAMALLASSPEVTGIVAHPFDPRDGFRLATPSDPFLTRDGGAPAAIRASEHLGEITAAEAERRQNLRTVGVDAEDPLETLWDRVDPRPRPTDPVT